MPQPAVNEAWFSQDWCRVTMLRVMVPRSLLWHPGLVTRTRNSQGVDPPHHPPS